MKRLRRVCMVLMAITIVGCIATLVYTSRPVTLEDVLDKKLGTEKAEEVYSTVQLEIANYIVQYGFKTDSWIIEKSPIFTDKTIVFTAVLKDNTTLLAVYNRETGECNVETENSSMPSGVD